MKLVCEFWLKVDPVRDQPGSSDPAAKFHCCRCLVTKSRPTLCDPWTAACQASLSFANSRSSLKLMSVESVMPSNHLILCRPLLLLPSIFPSIRVFSKEWGLRIRWPEYWSFSFSIRPSNEYSELISFKMDWFHLKTLFQHHSSKASVSVKPAQVVKNSATYGDRSGPLADFPRNPPSRRVFREAPPSAISRHSRICRCAASRHLSKESVPTLRNVMLAQVPNIPSPKG